MPPPPSTDTPAIELDGLERRYGERVALAGVSLTVARGATVAVLGPNGAGKSTLLRVLGLELPKEAWQVRGRIGYLGHEPLLYRDLSARENLLLHARLHGVAEGRVGELLETVGLAARADDPLTTDSRGMVQRCAIARAVLHDPELVLLDEPRANLDPGAAEILAPLLTGRTRVFTTHDPGEADTADEVLALRAGRPHALEGLYAPEKPAGGPATPSERRPEGGKG